MSCNLTEKISLLMDGALSNKEAAEARVHIATCRECRKALEDFLRFRDALQSYESTPGDVAQRRALNMILAANRAPLWTRRVSVPAPLLILLVLAFVALGVWSVTTHRREPSPPVTAALPAGAAGDAADQPAGTIAMDLSRLDHGGRAVIIKVPRHRSDEGQQSRRKPQ